MTNARLWWFLHILEAVKGSAEASGNEGEWVSAFCDDGADPDTLNLAIDMGLARATHDNRFDSSTVYITAAGREWLAAAAPPEGARP